jgi:hypothetical protein
MRKAIHFTVTYWLRSLCPAVFMLATTIIQAGESCTLGRSIDPIELTGKEFPDITGIEISQIRVFAYHDGQAIVIPFQIDQKNSRGDWVWDGDLLKKDEEYDDVNTYDDAYTFDNANTHDAYTYDDADPTGQAVFDENDLIVFVAHDAGDRNETQGKELGASSIAEVEISDPLTGGKCWIYVASYHSSEPPALSDIQYVRYLPEEHRVIGQEYEFRYSTSHNALIDDIVVGGLSIFDRNKMRGTVTAGIGFLNTDIEFNEESVQGYDVGYINGPVRVIKRSVNYVRTKSGMESPDVNCDHFFYPWHSEVPMLISLGFPVQKVSMLVTNDYRNSHFQTAYVDGFTGPIDLDTRTEKENLLAGQSEGEWIRLIGKHVSVVTLLKLPEEIRGYIDTSPYLLNDRTANNTPERYPGAEPEAGFLLSTRKGTPRGEYVLHAVSIFSAQPLASDDHTSATILVKHRLVAKVVKPDQE